VGSKGEQRARDGGPREHLPKVGTHDQTRASQRREREAIADMMGIGRAPGWAKWAALLVAAVLVIGGVVSLIALD
jgi:hypothetical protein